MRENNIHTRRKWTPEGHQEFDHADLAPLLDRYFGPISCEAASEWFADLASLRLRHQGRLLIHLTDYDVQHSPDCVFFRESAEDAVRAALAEE